VTRVFLSGTGFFTERTGIFKFGMVNLFIEEDVVTSALTLIFEFVTELDYRRILPGDDTTSKGRLVIGVLDLEGDFRNGVVTGDLINVGEECLL
jgi:hypothetical protein